MGPWPSRPFPKSGLAINRTPSTCWHGCKLHCPIPLIRPHFPLHIPPVFSRFLDSSLSRGKQCMPACVWSGVGDREGMCAGVQWGGSGRRTCPMHCVLINTIEPYVSAHNNHLLSIITSRPASPTPPHWSMPCCRLWCRHRVSLSFDGPSPQHNNTASYNRLV